MIQVIQIATGGFDHNFSYLVQAENGDTALIDPCGDAGKIHRAMRELHPEPHPRYILITHGHPDHISALAECREFFPAPQIGASEHTRIKECNLLLRSGNRLELGNSYLEVIATPGHSDDSVCYLSREGGALFTGDTLFVDWCGICPHRKQMYHSLKEVLYPLPDQLKVYSGHDYGHVPWDTLGNQKQCNRFLAAADYAQFQHELETAE